jgi:hypothetical protein
MASARFSPWSARDTPISSVASTAVCALSPPDGSEERAFQTLPLLTCAFTRGWEKRLPMSKRKRRTSKRRHPPARWVCRWSRWLQSCVASPRAEAGERPSRRRRRFESTVNPNGVTYLAGGRSVEHQGPGAHPAMGMAAARRSLSISRVERSSAGRRAQGVASYPHSVYSLGTSHYI